jgi:hypothetical protein
MVEREERVTPADHRLTLAILGAVRALGKLELRAYVLDNPGASVHDVCRDLLGGIELKCSGGTHRGYAAVYNKLRRARGRLESPPGSPELGRPAIVRPGS